MEKQISGLLITGLLAVLGTVAGGVIQGYWSTQLAAKEFQSQLILRALEPDDVQERIKSLQFLVDAKLLSDPDVEDGLKAVIDQGEEGIPQFLPENALPHTMLGEDAFATVKPAALQAESRVAPLVALRVRHGDVIDAITPVFAELAPDFTVKTMWIGERFGGDRGDETLPEAEGYIVTGLDVYRGAYFGKEEIVQFQVIWHKLTPTGIDPAAERISDKLGSGNFASGLQLESVRAEPGNYIDDLRVTISTHSDGSTYLHDIVIAQKPLPSAN